MINGCPAWNAHVSSAHGRVAENWSVGDSWEPGNKPKNQFMCLLCTVLLSSRTSLTQHYKRTHVRSGTFDRHFPCPECRRGRSDEPDQIITSASSWSNHVERVHGINYTPLLRTDATAKEVKSRCPFCGLCFDQCGFYAHFRSHVRDGAASDIFTSAFPCLRCSRDEQGARETERVMIEGWLAWNAHVLAAHDDVISVWTVGRSAATRKRKRQVDAEVELEPITKSWSSECSVTAEDVVTIPPYTGDPRPVTPVSFRDLDDLPIDPSLLDEDRRAREERSRESARAAP
jgi:hypothetical protein